MSRVFESSESSDLVDNRAVFRCDLGVIRLLSLYEARLGVEGKLDALLGVDGPFKEVVPVRCC